MSAHTVPITTGHVAVMLGKMAPGARVVLSSRYKPTQQPTVVLIERPGVGHFVCTWMDGGKRHFFDSYGKGHEYYGFDADESNDTVYQRDGEEATCGRHCAYRLKHRNMSDAAYAAMMYGQGDPDLIVTVATP